jgi:hypothetical protein
MTRVLIPLCAALVVACHGGSKTEEPGPVEIPIRPLATLASQRVIVTPAFSIRPGDPMGWAAALPRGKEYLRTLDAEIERELDERGLKSQWYFPPDLVKAARANPTYAADPYSLGVNVLRSESVVSGTRFGDPLTTQLRTMVALHEGARAVLVPVEVHFEKVAADKQVAVLRVVFVDGRLGDVRWAGNVRSDPATAFSPEVTKTLVTHFADLIAAP